MLSRIFSISFVCESVTAVNKVFFENDHSRKRKLNSANRSVNIKCPIIMLLFLFYRQKVYILKQNMHDFVTLTFKKIIVWFPLFFISLTRSKNISKSNTVYDCTVISWQVFIEKSFVQLKPSTNIKWFTPLQIKSERSW